MVFSHIHTNFIYLVVTHHLESIDKIKISTHIKKCYYLFDNNDVDKETLLSLCIIHIPTPRVDNWKGKWIHANREKHKFFAESSSS